MAENSVNYLKSINFRRLTLAEKVQIKDRGKDTPDLIISKPASSKGRYIFGSSTVKFIKSMIG